ncbi:MAG: Gfo/Idh/MocA family oxidoreductase [Oligoflexales bacterium]|nr:Gfo/Idh/MocA family oxidoreductase [Oligoflexales bacterium]
MIKLAQIGMGRWGRVVYKTSLLIPEIKITHVVSRNLETNSIVDSNVSILQQWEHLEACLNEFSGVILTCDPSVHIELLKYFLSNKKYIYVEKPAVLSTYQLLQLEEIVDPKYYFVNYVHLHSLHYQLIKNHIKENEIKIKGIESLGFNSGPVRNFSPLWDYSGPLF